MGYLLLEAAGKALIKILATTNPVGNVVELVAGEAFGVWQAHALHVRLDSLRSLAAATPPDVARQIHDLLDELCAGPLASLRDLLGTYLGQVQPCLQRLCRRLQDPDGKTLPSWLLVDSTADLRRVLPSHISRLRPGQPVPGAAEWTLERLLGLGGVGEVWLARNGMLTAAFKFCLAGDRAKQASILQHEATCAAAVSDEPSFVQVQDLSSDANPPWIRYQHVAGAELRASILEMHARGRASEALCLRQWLRLVRIVKVLHDKGLVHRDLKPSNVMVTADTRGELQLKVIDFGLGASVQPAAPNVIDPATTLLVPGAGAPKYMSPEQELGGPPTPRDDVFALGVIAIDLLTGKVDWPRAVDPTSDLELARVGPITARLVRDCLLDAARRPSDAARLERLLVATLRRLRRSALRRATVWGLVYGALLGGTSVVAYAQVDRIRGDEGVALWIAIALSFAAIGIPLRYRSLRRRRIGASATARPRPASPA